MAEINRRFYAKNKELATKAYADSSFTAARAYADTKKTEAITESETYTDSALANYLAKNNTTAYTPSGAYNPATKMYVDSSVQGVETQYTTMPTADVSNVGKVVQYTGNTNPDYEKGHFYECVSDGEDPATYSWEELNVQEPGGQAEVMPEPGADNVGQIIQYTGEDSGELEQGHFYICKEEEVSGIVNYSWEEINVQDVPPTVKKYEVTLTTDCLTDTGQGSRRLNEHDVTALSEFINWMGEQTEDVYLQINLANQPKASSIYGDSYYNVGTFRFTYPFGSSYSILYGKTPFMVPIYAVGGIPTPYHDKAWGYFAVVFLHYESVGSNYNNVSVSRDCFGYSAVASYGLTKDNRTSYTPTLDYHPATKKYVDDNTGSSVYDLALTGSTSSLSYPNTYTLNNDDKQKVLNIISNAYTKGYNFITFNIVTPNDPYPSFTTTNTDVTGSWNKLQSKPEVLQYYSSFITSVFSSGNAKELFTYYFLINLSWNGDTPSITSAKLARYKSGIILTGDNTMSFTPTKNYHPATKKYVDDTVASAMSAAIKREIVQELPVSDIKTDTIYMVPSSDPGTQNVYDEFMYINNAWEKIGSTDIDLSDYATKEYVEENTTQQKDTMPEPSADNVGEIVQYSGESDGEFTQGYFYICKETEISGVVTYYWEQVNAQPDAGKYKFFKGTQTEWDRLGSAEQQTILFAAVLPDEELVLTPEEEEDLTSSLGVDGDIEVDMSLEDALDAALDIANGN